MVAANDDRRLQLAACDHGVESKPKPMPIAQPHPADARRQPLKLDALARHVEPAMQMRIRRDELLHFLIRSVNILRVTRQRDPAKGANTATEERPDVGRDKAGEGKCIFDALIERYLPDVIAVVKRRHTTT